MSIMLSSGSVAVGRHPHYSLAHTMITPQAMVINHLIHNYYTSIPYQSCLVMLLLAHQLCTSSRTGYYAHIEASHMPEGTSASLLSTKLHAFEGNRRVVFFFHMFGWTVGHLSVLLRSPGQRDILLWQRRGSVHNAWTKCCVEYRSSTEHKIIFQGVSGSSVSGDIAIDDITFQSGSCFGMRKA
uniref:MAM domain-containing protein n=1 Tax=Eptatretus burgeri TaxID=7764 RepID=A0A8C4R5Y4_EPTBU